jgi:hypothetical protein
MCAKGFRMVLRLIVVSNSLKTQNHRFVRSRENPGVILVEWVKQPPQTKVKSRRTRHSGLIGFSVLGKLNLQTFCLLIKVVRRAAHMS